MFSAKTLKTKVVFLYLLNVFDIIFTLILLETSYFQEANVFMQSIVTSNILSIFVKIILPAGIVFYILYLIKQCDIDKLIFCNVVISISIIFYILVNLNHLYLGLNYVWYI
ncbi:hypothetical protein AN639_02405 [Candidatus Epulonipiscium fishelsonii]|uniref:Uncharacterized protein n=1 Tax=Candidatus Epulonipiscium fishelsonii TaxID=77094 RepID=A0ACC8XB19_9FIRM|nr:hypothetical protein AN396_07645 [Epulopiscium sp. SCG-B11WGA-EpuloA1]ONI41980.1 hypothetical protein AN639_02405 [Epulopiscium sp. SCG-B05WGA-EpuloA1]